MKQIRKRLTYANVMSSIAVFLVLGGAAIAAVQLPQNSVGAKQLKKQAVTTAKLKNNAVTGAKANESTFEQVPSALHANNADKATTATKADSATTADKATTATKADSATNAVNATNATNATNAANADALGGKAASEYSLRYFARVNGTTGTPTLAAGSPGVSVDPSRPFTGAATVIFPVDVTNCAIVATGFSGGGAALSPRQSSIATGNEVAIVVEEDEGNGVNASFNIVAVC